MFDPLGKMIYVKTQDDINKITAMFGSGSGFVYHILASYKKALEEMDINMEGEDSKVGIEMYKDLTLGLFEGAIELARSEKETELETLRQRVMSKKGTTEQGIFAMQGLDSLFLKGGKAACKRGEEIAKELNSKSNRKFESGNDKFIQH